MYSYNYISNRLFVCFASIHIQFPKKEKQKTIRTCKTILNKINRPQVVN